MSGSDYSDSEPEIILQLQPDDGAEDVIKKYNLRSKDSSGVQLGESGSRRVCLYLQMMSALIDSKNYYDSDDFGSSSSDANSEPN